MAVALFVFAVCHVVQLLVGVCALHGCWVAYFRVGVVAAIGVDASLLDLVARVACLLGAMFLVSL